MRTAPFVILSSSFLGKKLIGVEGRTLCLLEPKFNELDKWLSSVDYVVLSIYPFISSVP